MNRLKFLKSLCIGAAAVVIAPNLLVSKPLDGYTVPKPMIGGIKVGNVVWKTYTSPNGITFTLVFDERYDSARQSLINHSYSRL